MADIYRSIEAEIPRLRRYARALARDVAAADDLVQDCLTRALGKLHLWQEGTDLRAWLFTILHNTWRNRARDRARDTVSVDSEAVDRAAEQAPAGGVETPETLMLRAVLAPDIQAAIDELPESFRQAVWLRDVEEFSYAEIAAMLEIPIGTVMSRISRGRRTLFHALAAHEPMAVNE